MAVAAGGLVGATAFAGLVAYEVGTRLYEEREDLSGAVSLEEWMQLEAQGDVRAALRAVAARGLAQKARFQAWRFLLECTARLLGHGLESHRIGTSVTDCIDSWGQGQRSIKSIITS